MTETGYDPAAAITEALKGMTPDQAVKMVRELCVQLGADADGFHGNIWPDNVRLDWEGKAVLGEPSDEPANRREAEQVEYLAPEYFWDNEGSAAADVYSLGMLLYAACSEGYLPFQPRGGLLTAKDRSGALRKRMKGEPIAPPANVTPALASVIQKALAYEPEDRFISAAELLHALGETDEALPAPEADADGEQPVPAAEPETEEADGPAPEIEETAAPEASDPIEPETEDAAEDETEESSEPEAAEEPAPDAEPEAANAGEETPAEEPDINDILEAELSFLDLPNAEDETEEAGGESEPSDEPKYTVQKDFEEKPSERAPVPTTNQKKRTSPLIPILCVAAVVIIAAASVILQNRARPAETADEEETITYTIEPTLATAPPEPVEVTPSLDDNEAAEATAQPVETEAPAEAEEEPSARVGSSMIDGLAVEPIDDTVEISDTGANLRTGPGTNYSVEESLPRGTILSRTGTVNGWSQVQYNDQEYYVASNLVFTVERPADEPESQPVVSGDKEILGSIVVTADVNIRSGPGTDYAKVGEAKVGAHLTPLGRSSDGKWYRVSYEGTEGYVNRNLITVQNYAEVTAMTGTLTVVKDVNIRSDPGTGYDILGEGKEGETYTLTGMTDTGWYRIQYNGRMAYLAGEYASVS